VNAIFELPMGILDDLPLDRAEERGKRGRDLPASIKKGKQDLTWFQ